MKRFAWAFLIGVILIGCDLTASKVIVNSDAPGNVVVSQGTAKLTAVLSGGTAGGFGWTIESGGGSLSAPTGTTVTYTAPSATGNTSVRVRATVAGRPDRSATLTLTVRPPVVDGLVVSPVTAESMAIDPRARFVPGEAIVKWRANPGPDGVRGFRAVREMGDLQLLRMPDAGVSGQSDQSVGASSQQASATLAWIAALRARPDVEFADPNYLRFKTQLNPVTNPPNDERYAADIKPRFDLINVGAGAGGAWRTTTGSAAVVVAVLDDGILWRGDGSPDSHPDLKCGRVLPGYDMVSNALTAEDGGGRDPDPYPAPGPDNDHGTHVAGTVAACTNNGIGVSGVDWNAKVLPVRVLGAGGGSDADIIDGLRWAVGLPVSGVPANPNKAKVINLSLGGFGFSQTLDSIFATVTDQGAVVVAAAGNDNEDALLYWPAGAERVIAVGAVDTAGLKADFSNFGPGVEVMAPGGGILSTTGRAGGPFTYTAFNGTSMASPHVAGVVALMAAARPGLNWLEAMHYLKKSAAPVAGCAGCGAGLIDAADAVARAQRGDAVGAFITPSQRFIFDTGQTSAQVTLRNYGSAGLNFSAAAHPRLSLNPASGSIAPGQSRSATLSLAPPTPPGLYHSTLLVDGGNGHQAAILAYYQVGSGIRDLGPVKVALCVENGATSDFVRGSTVTHSQGVYQYSLTLPPTSGQSHYLRAWVDANGDNRTEFSTGRHYLSLNGKDKPDEDLFLSKQSFTLTQQGCIATP